MSITANSVGSADVFEELAEEIKMLEHLLKQKGSERKTCKTCGNECQMIGLNMPACHSYKEFAE